MTHGICFIDNLACCQESIALYSIVFIVPHTPLAPLNYAVKVIMQVGCFTRTCVKYLGFSLTICNEGAYLTFKSIFHKAINLFSSVVK